MKHVVVAGGGFGGVSCALALAKDTQDDVVITLLNRTPYHLVQSFLYEVATSPEELTDLSQLKHSIVVPLSEVVKGTRIKFQQSIISEVDPARREIILDHGKLPYDYLVLALGSTSNFYNIPGAEQYSISLKSLRDAMLIRNRLGFLIDTHRLDTSKQNIRIVIAGGGFSGVEVASELHGLLDFLSWKENYPRHKLQVVVVEGSNQLMPGMPAQMAEHVFNRLHELGSEIKLSTMISKVDAQFVEFNTGDRLEYDLLVWTAGVKAIPAPMSEPANLLDRSGRVITTTTFQTQDHPEIFAIGDQACFMDPQGHPLPGTARQAIHQGQYVAGAIAQLMRNQTPSPYICKQLGYIVPLGNKFAVFKSPHVYIRGFFPYFMRQVAWFHYFYTILGLRRALRLSVLEKKLYERND